MMLVFGFNGRKAARVKEAIIAKLTKWRNSFLKIVPQGHNLKEVSSSTLYTNISKNWKVKSTRYSASPNLTELKSWEIIALKDELKFGES